jgi:hypothetical protein
MSLYILRIVAEFCAPALGVFCARTAPTKSAMRIEDRIVGDDVNMMRWNVRDAMLSQQLRDGIYRKSLSLTSALSKIP